MDNLTYLKDIIKIAPEGAIISAYTTDEEFSKKILGVQYRQEKETYFIPLTKENINSLLLIPSTSDIGDHVQILRITYDDKLFFEGYDGLEFGTISNRVNLSSEFRKKYVEGDMCTVSREW